MKNYYFKNKIYVDDYNFIFLCGTQLSKNGLEKDKREVLYDKLANLDYRNRPIILENYFMPSKPNGYKKHLTYSEAGFSNLYLVEMLVNLLSDDIFIFLESISTGAEAGMFIGVPESQRKICLLIPDEMAVEDDKLGAFLRLATKKTEVNTVTFYPKIRQNVVSENVKHWHTSFNDDVIGRSLENRIVSFIDKNRENRGIQFNSSRTRIDDGFICYEISEEKMLSIVLKPRVLMICVGALFTLKDFLKNLNVDKKSIGNTIENIEKIIVNLLKSIFINSVAEICGIKADDCKIIMKTSDNDLSANRAVGMIIYLFYAADFINIEKTEEYNEKNTVRISCKMIDVPDDKGIKKMYFYEKYFNLLVPVPPIQIR